MKLQKPVESECYLTVIYFICPDFIMGFVTEKEKKTKPKK